jgi:hypothetical protein
VSYNTFAGGSLNNTAAISLDDFHEITFSTFKPDLAGSKENLPGQNQSQNQVWSLTWQVWFES